VRLIEHHITPSWHATLSNRRRICLIEVRFCPMKSLVVIAEHRCLLPSCDLEHHNSSLNVMQSLQWLSFCLSLSLTGRRFFLFPSSTSLCIRHGRSIVDERVRTCCLRCRFDQSTLEYANDKRGILKKEAKYTWQQSERQVYHICYILSLSPQFQMRSFWHRLMNISLCSRLFLIEPCLVYGAWQWSEASDSDMQSTLLIDRERFLELNTKTYDTHWVIRLHRHTRQTLDDVTHFYDICPPTHTHIPWQRVVW
jgi:hypothetical protein